MSLPSPSVLTLEERRKALVRCSELMLERDKLIEARKAFRGADMNVAVEMSAKHVSGLHAAHWGHVNGVSNVVTVRRFCDLMARHMTDQVAKIDAELRSHGIPVEDADR